MARRRLLTVQTPLGHRVFHTRERWRQIIRYKHLALAGVRTMCVPVWSHLRPSSVRESAKDPDVQLYYIPTEEVHLCVVTAPADELEQFVVTAYFTTNIKQGKELWKG
jgi:hypothetical protein